MAFTIDHTITSPNYFDAKQPIAAICLHGTSGPSAPSLSWLCNPNSDASANYLITKAGRIYCLVDPYAGRRAWANGIINNPDKSLLWLNAALTRDLTKVENNINQYTISIEHEALAPDMIAHNAPPDIQYQASLWLVAKLMYDFRLKPTDQTLTFHSQYDSINRPNCPGIFDRADYLNKLKGIMTTPNVNPDNYSVGPGMLAKLAELNDAAASNEQYFSPNPGQAPGLSQRSFVYTKGGLMLLGVQDIDKNNSPLPTWSIQVYKLQ